MSTWEEAPNEVISIAEDLIHQFHSELRAANIAFVMKSEDEGKFKIKPYQKWAVASKIPAKLSAILDYDFLIWIQTEIWNNLDSTQKKALIDHELSHCGFDENDSPKIIPHDFEEFSVIIERHGLWRHSLVEMEKAAKGYIQADIPDLDRVSMTLASPQGKIGTLTGDQLEKLTNKPAKAK